MESISPSIIGFPYAASAIARLSSSAYTVPTDEIAVIAIIILKIVVANYDFSKFGQAGGNLIISFNSLRFLTPGFS